MEMATKLQGIQKILVRNAVPTEFVEDYTEPYEITPEYVYRYDEASQKIVTEQKPWVVKDDAGKDCNSLLAPPALLSMMSQMHSILL